MTGGTAYICGPFFQPPPGTAMAKKPAAKKAAKPVKKASKPAAKKTAKKTAKAKPSKAVKPAPKKAPAKKAAPKKVVAKKPVAKVALKKVVNAPVKPVAKAQPVAKALPKKETKPMATKATAEKPAAQPAVKANVKKDSKSATVTVAPKEKKVKAPAAPAKPLVTQVVAPNRPMAPPMVKKQVSTLERADKLRYSDEELEEFKDIIMRKLDEARKDYDLLKQTLANTDNNGTDDTSPSFKMIEDGSETLSREETAQLASRQEKFIKHLEDAQLRIRNKTYGICRVTGRLISKERLRLVPHATLSIEAKQQMNS